MTRRPPKDPIEKPWEKPDGSPAEPPEERGDAGQPWRGPGDPKPWLKIISDNKEKKKDGGDLPPH